MATSCCNAFIYGTTKIINFASGLKGKFMVLVVASLKHSRELTDNGNENSDHQLLTISQMSSCLVLWFAIRELVVVDVKLVKKRKKISYGRN